MTELEALMTPAGQALIAGLPPYDPADALRIGERLRSSGLDPGLVAAALTQSRLRAKATAKFGEFAQLMLFTTDGLEQATRLVVAARHADRFRAAGCRYVADATCGIGADAMALAGLGLRVLAVDSDQETATVAGFNLRHFPDVEVWCADALRLDFAGVDGLWADPARRSGGKRRHDPNAYAPRLADILALPVADKGVKVGPGIAHRELPDEAATVWTSVDGDVVEAVVWLGVLAAGGEGTRTATVVHGTTTASVVATAATADVGPVGQYLFEPDGAVIRAGALTAVAEQLTAHLIDPTIAYLTGPVPAPTPFGSWYRVLDDMPFNLKQLTAYLRERQVGTLTVKKRGTALTPEFVRRKVSPAGPNSATIVLTRARGAHRTLIVEEVR